MRPAKTGLLIFLAVFLACSWFFSTGNWNPLSRTDAIMSFVEPPMGKRKNPDFLSFRINHFLISPEKGYNTGDWSFHNGNYYSNKAPGPLFLGIAVYAPLHFLEYLFFGFLDDILTDVFNMYIVNLFCSALPAALAAWCLFQLLLLLGCGKNSSAFWALAGGLATPLFCYSSMMWGHVLAAACFMFAIFFYWKKGRKNTLLCGFFCGYAVLTDYLCGVLVPVFALMLLLRALWEGEGENGKEKLFRVLREAMFFALGGLPPFILYAAYHKICFDSFLAPATAFNNPIFHDEGMVGGTFGAFHPLVIFNLLFSQHMGILFYSPVLFAFLPGFLRMIRKDREKKILAWGLLSVIVLTLLGVSCFNGWHGGACFPARYLIVTLPAFLVLCGMCPLEKALHKCLAAGAFLLSFFYMLITTYATPLVHGGIEEPFWGAVMTTLAASPRTPVPPVLMRLYGMIPDMKEAAARYSAFSLGELLGLSGYASVIMLTLLLAGIVFLIFRGLWKETFLSVKEALEKFLREREEKALFPVILFLVTLLLLFALPGMTVWIKDEPMLLLNAADCNDGCIFAAKGLKGSVGFRYGPVAVWFYQLLLLLSVNLYTVISLKVLATIGLSLWALKKLSPVLHLDTKTLFVFFFASPFAWHCARVLWDNVFLFPLSLALLAFVFLFFREEKVSLKYALGGGVCACVMLLLHPMSLPLAGLVPFVFLLDLILRKREEGKKFRSYLVIALSALAGALPPLCFYLPQITARFKTGGTLPAKAGNSAKFGAENLYAFLENLSGMGAAKHFIPELLDKGTETFCFLAGGALFLLFSLLFAAGIFFLLRRIAKREYSPSVMLEAYALLAILLKILMDRMLNLPALFHYQTAVVPAAGVLVLAGANFLLKDRAAKLIRGASCVMLALTVCFFLSVYLHDGSKTFIYGPTLGNQLEVVKKVNHLRRLGVLRESMHSVGNFKAFPKALSCLFFLDDHAYKPPVKTLPPPGVKYDAEIRYVTEDVRSGLLVLDIRQVAGPKYEIFPGGGTSTP
ncbi:MAG: hypothetical protein J6A21_01800 [Lentisphaeria bacterium]|nr:hypothetical protein [Lentisphaeria bacterium]